MTTKHVTAIGLAVAALALGSGLVWAAGQYGPGASDTEIKIGQTMPYSGPASAYGTIGKAESAYFAM
ncbi:MAG: branched-chain amino acid ABC transporter substrate-binding protein, partial [Hyphomicrobiales bacterium]|nr:branched-chain amino acid ABC transporter substrate-binding protein [Hyphomicrobiales bacterium]